MPLVVTSIRFADSDALAADETTAETPMSATDIADTLMQLDPNFVDTLQTELYDRLWGVHGVLI